MKRQAALIPLSHDHHDSLVAARRLRHGAETEPAAAAAAFLAFFTTNMVRHFRQEEELLFPQVADREETQALILAALLEHQRVHALAAQLSVDLAAGTTDPTVMRDLSRLLEAHVRLEERRLFPLIEELLGEEKLAAFDFAAREAEPEGSGPVWGTASEELNATVLVWRAGEGPPAHVNEERDVLVVVLEGSVTVRTDEGARELTGGEAMIIAKGRHRQLTAGPHGTRYVSAHRRRPPLQIRAAKAR